MTNQKFGRLTVISFVEHDPTQVKFRGARWFCKCECGNEVIKRTTELTTGSVRSCGCLNDEIRRIVGHNNMEDLTGKQFGELFVIEFYQSINQRPMWLCQCSCGQTVVVSAGHLKSGHTQSCGHLKSKGEKQIAKILTNNNILFEPQYKFNELKSDRGYPLIFDFAVFNNDGDIDFLIEYQGKQHFEPIEYFGGEKAFNIQKDNDKKKKEYAKEHNIPLIEITKNYKKIDITDLRK